MPGTPLITGLHHVTALASDAQANIDFYAGILGLRLVKKTINFDAPDVYHLYYGDESGSPGSLMTFFPYQGLVRGRKGKGQLTITSFSIAPASMDYWQKRLKRFGINYLPPRDRLGTETVLALEDFDGLGLELVAGNDDGRRGSTRGPVPPQHSIKGFYGVTLSEESYERTAGLLTAQMDHRILVEKGNRFRLTTNGKPGTFIDILCIPGEVRGLPGSGTVHHVAFATADDPTQLEVRARLERAGLNVTPVMDRQYFHSIYYREPGGVLFEAATVPPGFAIDEPAEHLGEALKLPPWQEVNRARIENDLVPISFNIDSYRE